MNQFYQFLVALFVCSCLLVTDGTTQARELSAQTNVAQAAHSIAATGVPTLSIEGVGPVAHPAWASLYALAYAGIEDYDPDLDLKPDAVRFQATIDWLKNNLVKDSNGLWVWLYNFDSTYNDVSIKAPWSSAFAQATGIQALLAHWAQTGDEQSLELAQKAAQSLFVPLAQGGFLFRRGEDIWFEEIPEPVNNPSHILNGHMRVLLALDELADATGDEQYRQWFNQGSDTLQRWLPLYDAGYWLRYDLNPRKEELLFRLANPYGFANPELAIDRIVLRDPVTGEETVLDIGSQSDAEGTVRIAGNDWGQIEHLQGRSVRRLRPTEGMREPEDSEGQMVAPFSYFYLKLPGQWQDNLRNKPYELSLEYYDEKPANLEVQMRSIAPGRETFKKLKNSDLLITGKGVWRQWKINIYPGDLGFWVGETYADKHSEYLHKLADKDSRFLPWADMARAYLNGMLSGGFFQVVMPKKIELPTQTPVLPVYSLDHDGVILMHMPSDDEGEKNKFGVPVYSPYIVASQAIDGQGMAGLEVVLKPLGIDKSLVLKEPALNWLLSKNNYKNIDESILYSFDFDNAYNDVETKAPWFSSFAQNYVVKALSGAVLNQSDDQERIKNVLAGVYNSYGLPVENGGVVSLDKMGGYFFEEVPNKTHVFNAQVSSIPALFEAVNILGDEANKKIIERGIASLRNNAYLFDTGYWLRYDLNPKKELLFQLDWQKGERSPLIESIRLEAPQFSKRNDLEVGQEQAFDGASHISGLEWLSAEEVDGRQVRAFANGYLAHDEPVQGGTRHNAFVLMQLPETQFSDYFDVQPHRLVIRYKDVATGQFVVKLQSINEGNFLDFTPLRNSVITTVGDQQWKETVVEVRPQDMGWYKGSDYQVFEVDQLEKIAKLTDDWFFAQYAERQRYYLDAKEKGEPIIIEPGFKPTQEKIALRVLESSETYDGFGFENALDGDANNNYVAGVENLSQNYVVLRAEKPITNARVKIKWESAINYAEMLRIVSVHDEMETVLLETRQFNGDDLELKLSSSKQFDTLRFEFIGFSGQPRVLLREIELVSNGSEEPEEEHGNDPVESEGAIFLSKNDSRNPLSVYRLPITFNIKELSDSLVSGVGDEHQKIAKFMSFIDQFEVGVAKTPSPDDTVSERKGDCGSFTNTLLALAAAQGMEGRVASLLNYPLNDGHAVAEIKVNGKWELYDPTYAAFYTLEGSSERLSLSEIRSAYLTGKNVVTNYSSNRSGVEQYTGKAIFTLASPFGVIGPDKPFVFPLSFDLLEKDSLQSSEFGARWQGANFIGAASTNQQQEWVFQNLKSGSRYRFEVIASWLGGDLEGSDSVFILRAEIISKDGSVHVLTHDFDFQDEGTLSWSIPFLAASEEQVISLKHDYLGPDYRYMMMQGYRVYKDH